MKRAPRLSYAIQIGYIVANRLFDLVTRRSAAGMARHNAVILRAKFAKNTLPRDFRELPTDAKSRYTPFALKCASRRPQASGPSTGLKLGR
jgi:hypothetical protein